MEALRPQDRLVVALDVDSRTRALSLVEQLRPVVGMFKIGSQLFTSCGPELVREIVASGAGVFLDLKFHDIPNTVAQAATAALRLGVSIFNVHALGGLEMMRQVRITCEQVAAREGLARPLILGVTLLTSHDEASLTELGINTSINDQVVRLARLVAEAGLNGVVASAHEIDLVRSAIDSPFIILTPGLRPEWASSQDQKRVMTPLQALRAGADYLVIGRPILEHSDPVQAATRIIATLT
ncbi:MAG: orotidine-5'-phosphate decarboxylase [Acidobacteriota bacterium]